MLGNRVMLGDITVLSFNIKYLKGGLIPVLYHMSKFYKSLQYQKFQITQTSQF